MGKSSVQTMVPWEGAGRGARAGFAPSGQAVCLRDSASTCVTERRHLGTSKPFDLGNILAHPVVLQAAVPCVGLQLVSFPKQASPSFFLGQRNP